MSDTVLPTLDSFWLIAALWVGVGNGLLIWLRRRTLIERGGFTQAEIARLATGTALWISVPALILFLVQSSIDGESTPVIWQWPSPQKPLGCAVQLLPLLALLLWVLRGRGATTLASYLNAQTKSSSSPVTPKTIQLLVTAGVIANMFAFWLRG